jgi:hypothetical protein
MRKQSRKLLTWVLGGLACVSSVSQYLLLRYGGGWSDQVLAFAGSGIWLALVIATQISGGWRRGLWWLWALFPVAFGLQLFVLYMLIAGRLIGFAP